MRYQVFQATAEEVAAYEDGYMWDAHKKFPLMHMNSAEYAKAIAWIIEEFDVEGGWFWWYCMPGCLPDSAPFGPFETRADAEADAEHMEEDPD